MPRHYVYYSCLVIDCNRTLKAFDCIPKISDGIVILGNANLSYEDRLMRINEIYQPFHTCVFQVLAHKMAYNPNIKLANIHSFTPKLATKGKTRSWDIGLVYRNLQSSQQIIQHLKQQTQYLIGDDEPYSGFIHKGYTIATHADAQDIPSFLVEFRQDFIDNP